MTGCKTCKKWPPFLAILQGSTTCPIMSTLLDRSKPGANPQTDAIRWLQNFTETNGCAAFEPAEEQTLRLWSSDIDHKIKNIEGDTPAYYTRNNIIAILGSLRDDLHLNANCVYDNDVYMGYSAVDVSDVDMVINEKIKELNCGGVCDG